MTLQSIYFKCTSILFSGLPGPINIFSRVDDKILRFQVGLQDFSLKTLSLLHTSGDLLFGRSLVSFRLRRAARLKATATL